jgi:hypothetical protein
MEDLFAPTTRFRDLYHALAEESEERDDDDDDDNDDDDDGFIFDRDADREMNRLVELELITGSLADAFLYRGFNWSDFYSWAHGKIVWVSRDVFFNLTEIDTRFQTHYRSFLTVYAVPNETGLCVCARAEAHATVPSDILLQFLTTSESREVTFEKGGVSRHFPVSGFAFSHFLVQSPNLRVLTLDALDLDTWHCLAIDALTGTDLRIQMNRSAPSELGEEILLECIRQNRGPTQLYHCRIDTGRLAGALRGNTSVTTLGLHGRCSDEERLVFVRALAENEGLVTLFFSAAPITGEMWNALWQSVARHPKLEKIWLRVSTWSDGTTDAQKALRMQVMVDALRVNTVLHTIELNRVDYDEDILDSTVYPLLLANKYRPRVRAIAQEEGEHRRKLLGRALGSTSSKPSLIWMLLSGNANVGLGPIAPPG